MENSPVESVTVVFFSMETVAALRGVSLSCTTPFIIPFCAYELEITIVKKTRVKNPSTNIFFNGHIGLNNVKKRLQLLYPEAHEISITENTSSYEVFLKIRLQEFTSSENEVKPATPEYAIA